MHKENALCSIGFGTPMTSKLRNYDKEKGMPRVNYLIQKYEAVGDIHPRIFLIQGS